MKTHCAKNPEKTMCGLRRQTTGDDDFVVLTPTPFKKLADNGPQKATCRACLSELERQIKKGKVTLNA